MEKSAPKSYGGTSFDKPYTDSHSVNDTLNELCGIAELSREMEETKKEVALFEAVLDELETVEKTVVTLMYHEGMTAEKVAEQIYVESEKTVYNIRNRAIAHFAMLYYGVDAKRAERFGKK